jgi:ABC-type molybdate transport system substrate-binding protein
MKVYDLKNRVQSRHLKTWSNSVSSEFTEPLIIRNLEDSCLSFVFDGNGSVELVDEQGFEVEEKDADAWVDLVRNELVNTLEGNNLTSNLVNLPNIRNILIHNVSKLLSIEEWLTDDTTPYSESSTKSVGYYGKAVEDNLEITGTLNANIVALNLPLTCDLFDLVTYNPNLKSVGINGDRFQFWNRIPFDSLDRIFVFVSSTHNISYAKHHLLPHFLGDIEFIIW